MPLSTGRRSHSSRAAIKAHADPILGAYEATPDIPLAKLQALADHGTEVAIGTIWRFFARRGITRKKKTAAVKLLIIDELSYVPLSTGAELLFEPFSQRYERGSTIVTSNLPFGDWTQVLSSERLTGALLDRLTHHVSILTMNGDSYWLKQPPAAAAPLPGRSKTRPPRSSTRIQARSPPPNRRKR